MGSSENMDAGRFSGNRSNFSQTCSLLSQYLKENGSFGDLSLGLTQNLEHRVAPMETMNLLPKIEESSENSGSTNMESGHGYRTVPLNIFSQKKSDLSYVKSEAEGAQMTIFYSGQVTVFNDFPAEKAKEIMTLASKLSAASLNHRPAAFAPANIAQSPAESVTSFPKIVPSFGIQERAQHQPPLGTDLPIARKNSLARFLEKRKDRVTASDPYQKGKLASNPPAARNEAWLGLAPQLPFQNQRH